MRQVTDPRTNANSKVDITFQLMHNSPMSWLGCCFVAFNSRLRQLLSWGLILLNASPQHLTSVSCYFADGYASRWVEVEV